MECHTEKRRFTTSTNVFTEAIQKNNEINGSKTAPKNVWLRRRVTACLKDNASVTQNIRDDLSHVEGCIAGSKTTKHKMFKPKTVAPSDTAVRAHLEQLGLKYVSKVQCFFFLLPCA